MTYKIRILLFLTVLALQFNNLYSQEKSLTLGEKEKFDYFFYEAVNARIQAKYDASFDYLQYCIAIDSTNAEALFEIGNYYNMLDDKAQAINSYRRAIRYNSDNLYYNIAYGALCMEENLYDEAVDVYKKLVDNHPDNNELYVYLSEAYRLSGDTENAIKVLDRLETIVGLNEKISLQKFQLYTMLKKEDKAFSEIQKYIDKYPNETKYRVLLGDLYMQANKHDEALATYNKAKAIDAEDPYLVTSMAEYYEKTGNKVAAENEMKAALVNAKMDVNTKLAILAQYVGTLQQSKQDTRTVNPLFDTLLVQHPQEPKLNLMYGNLYMLQENKPAAREQFKIYAEANPTNPVGWEQMLSTAFPDSIKLSAEICKEALKNLPDQPQFWFYLGLSQYLDKDYQTALKTLKKGVGYVDEQNKALKSDFYGQMGDLYYQTGMSDSAYVTYDKALELNPGNVAVLNNYSYYLSLEKKNLNKAERMSGLTIKAEPTNPTYLDTYGWILFEQGVYSMAKIYLENAVKYSQEQGDSISSEVYEHYGDVLYKTGETEKAVEYWMKAKEAEEKQDDNMPTTRKSETLEEKIRTKTYIEKE